MGLYDENQLRWGLELEITGNTRGSAAKVLQDFFGVPYVHEGTHYDKYSVTDRKGRKWVVMSDASIIPLKKVNGAIRSASDLFKDELVSPPLMISDISEYQEIIRLLRKAGFFPSETCGVHIHISSQSGLSHKTVINVLNHIHSKQDLLYKALGVNTSMSGRYRYCKRIPTELVENLKKKKPSNLSDIANIWYSTLSNLSELRGCRYPSARYHCINLCRLFPGPYCYHTIEFRCYPSSLHAGKLKSFIQLSALIVSHCNEISKSSYKPTVVGADESEAYKFRCWLLHLGAIGPEFSTLRHHLLGEHFGTQSKAWRRGDRTSA